MQKEHLKGQKQKKDPWDLMMPDELEELECLDENQFDIRLMDEIRRSPPGMYKTLSIMVDSPYQLVQEFFPSTVLKQQKRLRPKS